MTITQQQAREALERVYYATHASFIDRNLVRQYIEQSTAQPQAVVPARPVPLDVDLERLIDDSDGTWHEDVFHIDSAMLMCLLRNAYGLAESAAQPSAQAERAPVVQAVQAGFVMVPVEPTWEMTKAAIPLLQKQDLRVADISVVYRAMIAAAQPGAQEQAK